MMKSQMHEQKVNLAADGSGQVRSTKSAKETAKATLPLQLRTSYAVGGLAGCETVLSVTNLSRSDIEVQVEFFTGFNFINAGLAVLKLQPGETGEMATADNILPYVINAVRDSRQIFEGYANIHAVTSEVGVQANMICGLDKDLRTYEDLNVFRPPFQQGD